MTQSIVSDLASILPGMPDVTDDLALIKGLPTGPMFSMGDERAWAKVSCDSCSAPQMLVIVRCDGEGQQWLRCPTCKAAAIVDGAVVLPRQSGLRNPAGQPEPDQYVWDEVRACMSAGAHNAVVMLCRKLLFHLAVSQGLPPKNARNRAPSFEQAVNHLEAEGLVTSRMRPWVVKIKDVGNEANHEIPRVTAADARTIAKFTEQMLLMTYEYPADLEESAPLEVPEAGQP
ncbi:hypothetical protein ENKNEFLB_01950 [Nocardioides aquaticus]|uniref:DUF4145 domain-containing protein n=2 Tax=Actinomycetes TaxID=1760 RepID=A0ABN1SVQ6_9ACTN|nr:DUF4145 domain-containing protein [Nocardioides aquaticus]QVT79567.1 hypothetical protein ENKNEFLB_01950 [Nocardioides aquaticus]